MVDQKVLARKELPIESTWNAESVYASAAAWEAELKAIQAALPGLTRFQGHLKENPTLLAEALAAQDELRRRTDIAVMYGVMCYSVDKTNQSTASMPGVAQGVMSQVLAGASFIEPELIAIGEKAIQEWMDREAKLKTYAQYFDDLFRKQAHIRSTEVEELLGMVADPFSNVENTASMLTDADFKFSPATDSQQNKIEVFQGSYQHILDMPDRTARRSAWESYTGIYLAFKNTLANNLTTSIKQNTFKARARRHASTLEASLFELNIPVEVFYALIDTFRKYLPTWHRYFAVRRKALGVEQLNPYDMWAPLTTQRPQVPYRQAVEWICQGLAPMGEEYVKVLRQGCLQDRWVDIYPNQGKTAGAFSYGAMGTLPFVVMSYNDDLAGLSTLAHELGHSMHSYLTWKHQPYIYSSYSLFVAETASNFHQAMVRAYLLENEHEANFQICLIEEAMANFYRYFLIMPTLARFELETHQRIERGEGLSADEMNRLMADLFQEAYGEAVQVDRERVGITWATFGHLYTDYYVFQYATGISGAHTLSKRILSGVEGGVGDYLSFLRAGNSMYPLDALKIAGVDLTSPKPVEETFSVLSGMVDRLEELLG